MNYRVVDVPMEERVYMESIGAIVPRHAGTIQMVEILDADGSVTDCLPIDHEEVPAHVRNGDDDSPAADARRNLNHFLMLSGFGYHPDIYCGVDYWFDKLEKALSHEQTCTQADGAIIGGATSAE